jgi:glycosyltransferase involved in cell wall biosynthesis
VTEPALPGDRIPEIAVVVPSHDRPVRLLWLLNALEEQTLARERFEVVVAHDSAGSKTAQALRDHPLAGAGVLRDVAFSSRRSPAALRNAAWRAARAPLVAFTDDDCRPAPDWLERLLDAARRHPGAIVQGATRPDPDEIMLVHHAPHARTLTVQPPVPWAQTSNILYPREVLERVGGFDEGFPHAAGEDTDLAQRAIAAGAEYTGEAAAVTYHAVHATSLPALLRSVWRWQAVPLVVKAHPHLRRDLPLRVFWKTRHARLVLALGGLALARRGWAAVLVLPWAWEALPSYGAGPRGYARAISELPGRALVDLVEIAALVRGSVRHRTFLL